MDWDMILSFISEAMYFLIVFGLIFLWATLRGYWAIARLIMGLYLALLLFFHFPYLDQMSQSFEGPRALAFFQLIFFGIITLLATIFCKRIMPDEGREGYFEIIPRKLLLTLGATILVMSFSFQVLPVSDLIATGTPLQSLFGPESTFFWWLLAPFVILYFI